MSQVLSGLPRDLGLYMPAEWAPHSATWMSWPFDEEMWFGHLTQVRQEYSMLVKTLARFEPVHLLVRDEEAETTAKAALEGVSNLTLHRIPLDDVWMRDNGPLFLLKQKTSPATAPALSFVNWGFNAWGGKYDYERDNQVPLALAEILQLPRFDAPYIMEGGSLEINGEGSCLTTEQCLLTPTRNPDLGKADLEKLLSQYLGIDQVIWLKDGLEGDHTDGHIDTITRFANSTTVLTSVTSDRTDVNFDRMQENLEILRRARLKDGRNLRVIELPLPEEKLFLEDGTRLPPTYANFYIANGAVLVPQYGDRQDAPALDVLRRAFPQHQVFGLASRHIISGGGSFHCLTQQQPRS
ncbi:agmatine deiminase family protein [Oligoflexus tunisiensis]|uniref:agmatine deiminase family protein n=1 Tax=Oligoflexus tunisiensis TaxID=708132 RepID=UPI000AD17261|nr:agmatine deiminase family protein [Oligoflexus tunisiensis]